MCGDPGNRPAGSGIRPSPPDEDYHVGEVEVRALRDVTLALPQGEFVVLLGPSGSGKSTLLNIMGGLDVPTAGEVLYHGDDLARPDEAPSRAIAAVTSASSSSSTT
jgi:putative ABC transport system ATP-binding protein